MLALVVLGSGAVGHAADGSRFRGPNGAAVGDSRGVPTDWSDSTNLRHDSTSCSASHLSMSQGQSELALVARPD
ncbi:MAG: hypothetical protein FJ302_19735 [Planctomycetes bacterium]|nr:hypothetical protein [Planctomycetota bacterium]